MFLIALMEPMVKQTVLMHKPMVRIVKQTVHTAKPMVPMLKRIQPIRMH